MSQLNTTHDLLEESLHKGIRAVSQRWFSWAQLADFALYKGESSMKNIVNQGSHELSAVRFAALLKNLSKQDNHFLHGFVIDTRHFVIAPRVQPDNESLTEKHNRLLRMIGRAESALQAGNMDRLQEYHKFLLSLASAVQQEIQQNTNVLFRSELDEIRTPSAVNTRSGLGRGRQESTTPDHHNSSSPMDQQAQSEVGETYE